MRHQHQQVDSLQLAVLHVHLKQHTGLTNLYCVGRSAAAFSAGDHGAARHHAADARKLRGEAVQAHMDAAARIEEEVNAGRGNGLVSVCSVASVTSVAIHLQPGWGIKAWAAAQQCNSWWCCTHTLVQGVPGCCSCQSATLVVCRVFRISLLAA